MVSNQLRDVLADSSAPIHDFVDRSALEGLLSGTREVPWYGQLMTTPSTIAYFLQMNFWLKEYKVRIIS
jgi:asparagine synthase (glutamine-hydrolysing)